MELVVSQESTLFTSLLLLWLLHHPTFQPVPTPGWVGWGRVNTPIRRLPRWSIFIPGPSMRDQAHGNRAEPLCPAKYKAQKHGSVSFFLMSECQKLEQTSRKARHCPSQFPTQAGFLSHLKEMQSFLLCASESPRNKGYSRHSTARVPTVGLSASC